MQLKDMFVKPIDRDIQGVIIVGQGEETNVAQELEEYVVTKELQKHFADFFSAYKKGILGTTPKMGVWISGFFGSGKSHFLKILSYLLSNDTVAGKKAVDYLRRAAESGNPSAEYSLGHCYETGFGVKADEAEALYLYRLSARHGNEKAVKILSKRKSKKQVI